LPADCALVARIEWRALSKHPLLGPKLGKWMSPSPGQQQTPEQRAFFDFLGAARVDPLTDIEQLAACMTGADHGPLWIVAGSLPAELVRLLDAHAPAAMRAELNIEQHAGASVLRRKQSYLVQAEDRALLLGGDLPVVLQARQLSAAHQSYRIPERAEVAAVVLAPVAGRWLSAVAGSLPGLAESVTRLELELDLQHSRVRVSSEHETAEQAERCKTQLSELVRTRPALGSGPFGRVLGLATFSVDDRRVTLELPLASLMQNLPGIPGLD
jgi:hypothetical protein